MYRHLQENQKRSGLQIELVRHKRIFYFRPKRCMYFRFIFFSVQIWPKNSDCFNSGDAWRASWFS